MAKLKVNRGTYYTRTVYYKKDGEAVDITGMEVYFTMKSVEYDSSAADESALITKNYDTFEPEDAVLGKFTIELWPNDTNLLEPGEYFYDIKIMENPLETVRAKRVYKLEEGTIILDGSPTNRAV